MSQEQDLPKSIIVILVVLAVAISILGTFTVVNEMKKINDATPVYDGDPSASAKVRFEVVDPNEGFTEATGKVTFAVQDLEVN